MPQYNLGTHEIKTRYRHILLLPTAGSGSAPAQAHISAMLGVLIPCWIDGKTSFL